MATKVRDFLANAPTVEYYPHIRDFSETYGFPLDVIEAVVRNPTTIEWDPATEKHGYPIVRIRRGDVTLSVSLKSRVHPYVMFIHLHFPEEEPTMRRTSGGRVGSGKTPKSPAEMQAYFIGRGCDVTRSANGMKVTYKGRLVGVIHLTGHVYGSGRKSDFSQMRRSLFNAKVAIAASSVQIEGDSNA